jgi:hypothetical protein
MRKLQFRKDMVVFISFLCLCKVAHTTTQRRNFFYHIPKRMRSVSKCSHRILLEKYIVRSTEITTTPFDMENRCGTKNCLRVHLFHSLYTYLISRLFTLKLFQGNMYAIQANRTLNINLQSSKSFIVYV